MPIIYYKSRNNNRPSIFFQKCFTKKSKHQVLVFKRNCPRKISIHFPLSSSYRSSELPNVSNSAKAFIASSEACNFFSAWDRLDFTKKTHGGLGNHKEDSNIKNWELNHRKAKKSYLIYVYISIIYIYICVYTYIHTLHYITLHTYITLHNITLHTYIHYITSYIHYITYIHTYITYIHTLHYITYITLHYITYITLHYIHYITYIHTYIIHNHTYIIIIHNHTYIIIIHNHTYIIYHTYNTYIHNNHT